MRTRSSQAETKLRGPGAGMDADYQKLASAMSARPTRTRRCRCVTPSWWSAPARSDWRRRSIWRSRACASCCSTRMTAFSPGSRAICFAKRTLEIFDRLGCGERVVQQGRGLAHGEGVLPRRAGFQLRSAGGGGASPPGLRQPAAILRRGLSATTGRGTSPKLDIRWRHRVVGVVQDADGVTLDGRHAGRASIGCAATISSPPMGRAARCAGCSGTRARGRFFATAS